MTNKQLMERWVKQANFSLANSALTQENKQGICGLLECALHDTNSYAGYRYLNMYKEGDDWKWPNEYDREYFMPRKKA